MHGLSDHQVLQAATANNSFCVLFAVLSIAVWCMPHIPLSVCLSVLSLTDNAIPIKSWFCDPHDTALLNLLPVLDALRFTTDVRSVLSRNLHLNCLQ